MMMVRRLPVKTLVAGCLLLLCRTAPVSGAGTVAVRQMEISPVSRPYAMGNAFCAVVDDINSVFFNPAGLACVRGTEVQMSVNDLYGSSSQRYYAVAYNLHDFRASNVDELGTIAVSLAQLDRGAVPFTGVAAISSEDYNDEMLSVAYGKKLFARDWLGLIDCGVSAKFIDEDLENGTLKSQAFDGGLLWRDPRGALSLGVSVLNMGRKASYRGDSFELPLLARYGCALKMMNGRLLMAADVLAPRTRDTAYCAGAEYRILKAFVLRAGYDSSIAPGTGFTAGAGIMLIDLEAFFFYARELSIDYAFMDTDGLESVHRFTLTIKLGAE